MYPNNDEGTSILYAGRFFETRLQAGDPPDPPLIILSLITAETNQALILTMEEMTELFLASAATLAALTGSPPRAGFPLLMVDERLEPLLLPTPDETPDAAVVFPTRRSP